MQGRQPAEQDKIPFHFVCQCTSPAKKSCCQPRLYRKPVPSSMRLDFLQMGSPPCYIISILTEKNCQNWALWKGKGRESSLQGERQTQVKGKEG